MRLYQRGERGIWWVDFTIAGRPRFTRSAGTEDKRKAEEWAAQAQADQWRQSKLGDRPKYLWDDAVRDWIGKHQDERRSIETMKDRLRWISKKLEGVLLTSITRARVEKVMDEKRAEGIPSRAKDEEKRKPPRPVAPKTLNNYVGEISKIINHARGLGWLDAAPKFRVYEVDEPPIAWLSRDEADKLLAELPPHLARMAEFALATGLREANVRLLRWMQVDMQRGVAWIEASEAKAKKPFAVPLNADAMAVLQSQRGQHAMWVFPFTPIAKGGKPGKAGPVSGCSTAAWYKATKRAGVPDFRWHDLRHTWASWHVQAGTPLPVLQQLGGWKTFAMVQRYAHLGRDHTAAYADAVSRYNGGTRYGTKAAETSQGPDYMGWLMGLEPTTTGITTRDSTN